MWRLNSLFLSIILAASWLYRLIPAMQGHPVFGNDTWDLMRDVSRSVKGLFIPFTCSPGANCYYNYWPSPVIHAHVLALLTGLDLTLIPPLEVLLSAILISIVSMHIVKILSWRGVFGVAILQTLIWPSNTHYSSFKAEALALPLETLIIAQLIRALHGASKSLWISSTFIIFSIVSTHHFTTYSMLWVSGLLTLWIHMLGGLRRFNRSIFQFFLLTLGVIGLYYAVVKNAIAASPLPLEAAQILVSYTATLSMIATAVMILLPTPPRHFIDLIIVAAALTPLPLLSRVATAIGAPLPGSLGLLAAGFSMAGLAILASRVTNMGKIYRVDKQWLLTAWALPPLSLSLYSLFEGIPLLAYRGFAALSIPLTIMAAPALSRKLLKRGGLSIIALIFVIISAATAFYMISDDNRDPYTGSLWLYSREEVRSVETLLPLSGNRICTDARLRPVIAYFAEYLESNLEILHCTSIVRGDIEGNTTAMISMKIYPFIMISGGRLAEVMWDQIYRYSLTYSSNLLKTFTA
jgi:hypothetical protein